MSKLKKPNTFVRILNILFNGWSFADAFYLLLASIEDMIGHLRKRR